MSRRTATTTDQQTTTDSFTRAYDELTLALDNIDALASLLEDVLSDMAPNLIVNESPRHTQAYALVARSISDHVQTALDKARAINERRKGGAR
jgi:hypothetical protein